MLKSLQETALSQVQGEVQIIRGLSCEMWGDATILALCWIWCSFVCYAGTDKFTVVRLWSKIVMNVLCIEFCGLGSQLLDTRIRRYI